MTLERIGSAAATLHLPPWFSHNFPEPFSVVARPFRLAQPLLLQQQQLQRRRPATAEARNGSSWNGSSWNGRSWNARGFHSNWPIHRFLF
jgi:hypothetical protein